MEGGGDIWTQQSLWVLGSWGSDLHQGRGSELEGIFFGA